MVIVIIGIAIGLWLSLSCGTFFILACALIIFVMFGYALPQEDRSFIFKVILVGFAARITLALLYYYFYLSPGNIDILGPDGDAYSQRGWYISRLLLGQNPYALPDVKGSVLESYYSIVEYYKQQMPPIGLYQVGIFTYFMGILFSIFNYCPLMVKFLNAGLSVLTGVVVYFLGKEVFNARIGKVSMVVFIFMPSIFLFSITALKDPLITFTVSLIILLMVKLQNKFNLFFLVLILGFTILIESLRSRMVYPLMLFILSSLLAGLRLKLSRKIIIMLVLIASCIAVPKFANLASRIFNLENFFSAHIGYINTPGNNYKIFPDKYYANGRLAGLDPSGILLGFLSGVFHLLFEPLPGRVDGVFGLIIFLSISVGYFLIPFVLIGLVSGLKYKKHLIMPLLIFLVIFLPLVAVSEGNVGTAFRHRDMFMPFFILLGVMGYFRIKLGKGVLK